MGLFLKTHGRMSKKIRLEREEKHSDGDARGALGRSIVIFILARLPRALCVVPHLRNDRKGQREQGKKSLREERRDGKQ